MRVMSVEQRQVLCQVGWAGILRLLELAVLWTSAVYGLQAQLYCLYIPKFAQEEGSKGQVSPNASKAALLSTSRSDRTLMKT